MFTNNYNNFLYIYQTFVVLQDGAAKVLLAGQPSAPRYRQEQQQRSGRSFSLTLANNGFVFYISMFVLNIYHYYHMYLVVFWTSVFPWSHWFCGAHVSCMYVPFPGIVYILLPIHFRQNCIRHPLQPPVVISWNKILEFKKKN